jgi:glycosyltransferase involved in cell wall biosynthesis
LQESSAGFTFILFMSNPIDPRTVAVVIPSYNEERVIRTVVDDVRRNDYEVIVVDDGSAIALTEILNGSGASLLTHPVNLGQGAALQTGIEFALQQPAIKYIVTFDADGQHMSSDILPMLERLDKDSLGVVTGSRFLEGASHNMTAGRKRLIGLARIVNYVFTGMMLTDAHNGLRVFSREAASHIQIQENGMAHATELLSQIKEHKLRYAEVPVNIHYSAYSKAKGQSMWSGFRIFFDLLLNKLFQ